MQVLLSDADAFTAAVVDRLQAMVSSGQLPAERWEIDGPAMPPTHVQGTATTYTARVGETEVMLRRCDIFPGRSNPDWIYTIEASRGGHVIAHSVNDYSASPLGQLIDAVREICAPTVIRERAAAAADLGIA